MTESYVDKIICGDCLNIMTTINSDSIDSIVTDPPYGLNFMGKEWDYRIPGIPFWEQALRVAKPGAHLLAFGGTRTFHRLMIAIEDAGWEIRDTLMWVYGSGFPKSQNVALAIDKKLGAVGNRGKAFRTAGAGDRKDIQNANGKSGMAYMNPRTEVARKWNGWGTALKPAWEPIILARKPFKGSVADNVLKYGTGALNIDGCRIPVRKSKIKINNKNVQDVIRGIHPQGRWPANLIHDGSDEVISLFPNKAKRFFYCTKASKSERNMGCEELEKKKRDESRSAEQLSMHDGTGNPYNRGVIPVANHHPTIKPIALMRYLVRLVTPPNGVVLDPFCGSGSTGIAAFLEGFHFIGIDIIEEYCEIARLRIAAFCDKKI